MRFITREDKERQEARPEGAEARVDDVPMSNVRFAIIVPELTLFYEDGRLVEITCGDDRYVKAGM